VPAPKTIHQRLARDGIDGPADLIVEIVSVAVPGLWIDPAWLWQNPTPNVAETLRTIEAGC